MQKRLSEAYLIALQEMTGLYEQMLSVMETEKSAVAASDIDALVSATAEKQRLLAQLAACEQRGRQLTHQITAGKRPIDLASMLDLVAPEERGALKQTGTALKALLEKIRLKNRENRLLVQHCLTLVQNSLSFFNHWNRAESVYGATGTMRASKGGRLLSNNA